MATRKLWYKQLDEERRALFKDDNQLEVSVSAQGLGQFDDDLGFWFLKTFGSDAAKADAKGRLWITGQAEEELCEQGNDNNPSWSGIKRSNVVIDCDLTVRLREADSGSDDTILDTFTWHLAGFDSPLAQHVRFRHTKVSDSVSAGRGSTVKLSVVFNGHPLRFLPTYLNAAPSSRDHQSCVVPFSSPSGLSLQGIQGQHESMVHHVAVRNVTASAPFRWLFKAVGWSGDGIAHVCVWAIDVDTNGPTLHQYVRKTIALPASGSEAYGGDPTRTLGCAFTQLRYAVVPRTGDNYLEAWGHPDAAQSGQDDDALAAMDACTVIWHEGQDDANVFAHAGWTTYHINANVLGFGAIEIAVFNPAEAEHPDPAVITPGTHVWVSEQINTAGRLALATPSNPPHQDLRRASRLLQAAFAAVPALPGGDASPPAVRRGTHPVMLRAGNEVWMAMVQAVVISTVRQRPTLIRTVLYRLDAPSLPWPADAHVAWRRIGTLVTEAVPLDRAMQPTLCRIDNTTVILTVAPDRSRNEAAWVVFATSDAATTACEHRLGGAYVLFPLSFAPHPRDPAAVLVAVATPQHVRVYAAPRNKVLLCRDSVADPGPVYHDIAGWTHMPLQPQLPGTCLTSGPRLQPSLCYSGGAVVCEVITQDHGVHTLLPHFQGPGSKAMDIAVEDGARPGEGVVGDPVAIDLPQDDVPIDTRRYGLVVGLRRDTAAGSCTLVTWPVRHGPPLRIDDRYVHTAVKVPEDSGVCVMTLPSKPEAVRFVAFTMSRAHTAAAQLVETSCKRAERLFPIPRFANEDAALEARTHDGLWFLTRQWQMAELQGDDAAPPLSVEVCASSTRISQVALGVHDVGGKAPASAWQAYDPAREPLEARVEAERIVQPLRRPMQLGNRIQQALGREHAGDFVQLARLYPLAKAPALTHIWVEVERADAYEVCVFCQDLRARMQCTRCDVWRCKRVCDVARARQALTICVPVEDREAAVYARAVQSRLYLGQPCLDGEAVMHALHHASLPAAAVSQAALAVLHCLLDVERDHFAVIEPADEAPAWDHPTLGYHARVKAGSCELDMPDYSSGEVNWTSFVVDNIDGTATDAQHRPHLAQDPLAVRDVSLTDNRAGAASLALAAAGSAPVALRIPNSPISRFWQYEDGETDFGDPPSDGSINLARQLVMQYALNFGQDWFQVLCPVPLGSLVEVERLVVTDAFGFKTHVLPAAENEPVTREDGWAMYTLACRSRTRDGFLTSRPSPFLFLPPVLTWSQESKPVEEVRFVRDEDSNMAWAVEHRYAGLAGTPVDPTSRVHDRDTDDSTAAVRTATNGAVTPASSLAYQYKVVKHPPRNWWPYFAARTPMQVGQSVETAPIALTQGYRMARDGTLDPAVPASRLLSCAGAGALLNEEEVERSGVAVQTTYQRTRWFDGRAVGWLGRKVLLGTPEQSSGLGFDVFHKAAA